MVMVMVLVMVVRGHLIRKSESKCETEGIFALQGIFANKDLAMPMLGATVDVVLFYWTAKLSF